MLIHKLKNACLISLMGFTLLGCNKNDEPKVSQNENLSLSELKEVKSELDKAYGDSDIQTHSNDSKDSALKEAMFRTNGAWVNEEDYNNVSHNCAEIIAKSDKMLWFERFTQDLYIGRMRVGARSPMWQSNLLATEAKRLDSVQARLPSKISFEGDVAAVTAYQSATRDLTKRKYRFNESKGVLENFDLSCVDCQTDITKTAMYVSLKEFGSFKLKFCRGSYE